MDLSRVAARGTMLAPRPPRSERPAVFLRRTVRTSVVVVTALATLVIFRPVPAGAATVRLTASIATATYGDDVTLSGAVGGRGECADGRTVRLRWQPADATGFSLIAEGAVAADGTFAFDITPSVNARYRVALVASGDCPAEASNEVPIRVRARVDASIVVGSSVVGSCVDLTAIVSPAKPGQTVELQRRGGGWRTVATLPLNGDSEARGHPCLGWDDLGVARYRVRWTSQDPLNDTATSQTLAFEVARPAWMERIGEIVGRRAVSVSVGEDDVYLYRHLDQADRTPASNEKLLLAMAMLDAFGPDHRIETIAATSQLDGGAVDGDLWLLGRGDPIVTRSSLGNLADAIVAAGITRITGSVMGSTSYFARDWDARGWNSVATDYVNRPTALTFEGNRAADPERAAAEALTRQLEERGVAVRGRPGSGDAPAGVDPIAILQSRPMSTLLAKMLRPSWNFAAEVLGKALGVEFRGTPGTIAKGAAAIEAWVRANGVGDFELYDNSGLSYANRVDAAGIVRLLWAAEDATWGDALRNALPGGGQGTLEDRLERVRVRAKTGTLTDVSSLSGWVWAERPEAWIEFSIVSDVGKPTAEDIEDKIVRIVSNNVG
jgi:D-alanyl-D-alanine carboxypeptidase